MAFRAIASHRFEINHKLALRIAIAGIKNFAKARTPLNQMAGAALRALQGGVIGFVDLLGMFTLRVAAATDKHAKAPLAEHQRCIAYRTLLAIQHFDNVTIRLPF